MTVFTHDQYYLKRQTISLTGRFRIYNSQGNLLMFAHQKILQLREDIRVYADESMTHEVLYIRARQIIDFSAAFDVIDSTTGMKVGALRRRGWRSLVQDEWHFLDVDDRPIAIMQEDSLTMALVRRILTSLVPQRYEVTMDDKSVAEFRQNFNPFTYRLQMDFAPDSMHRLDRRLGVAAGVLLGSIEGRQG